MQPLPPSRKKPLNPAIITQLQATLEAERIAVARELHDEMGGHLVAAVMDVAWAEQHLDSPQALREKLARVRQSLSDAIDLKRSLIEQLRPSLLDNFGLFTACRWHVKRACGAVGVACTDWYPAEEPSFTPDALTGLYRILQDALAITLKKPSIQSLDVKVTVAGDMLTLRIAHVAPTSSEVGEASAPHAIALAIIRHRVRQLGGQWTMRALKRGGQVLTARFDLQGPTLSAVAHSLLTH